MIIETDDVATDESNSIKTDYSASSKQEAATSLAGGFIFSENSCGYDVNGELRVNLCSFNGRDHNSVQIFKDGEYLLNDPDENQIYNIDMTGRILTTYFVPEEEVEHHDTIYADNGMVYSLSSPIFESDKAQQATDDYKMGYLNVYDGEKGGYPVVSYDINQYFEKNLVNNRATNAPDGTDILHLNAVDYDENTNTVILSSQTQNMVIGIDADNGDLLWTTASADLGNNTNNMALTQSEDFVQSNGQHSVELTSNPKYDDVDDRTIEVTMFDNRYCEDENGEAILSKSTPNLSGEGCVKPDESLLLVYRIDLNENTVTTLAEYEVPGLQSDTRGSWFESTDYQYNYITYAELGELVITDDDFEEIMSAKVPNTNFSYRINVFSEEQLNDNLDNSIAKY